MVFLWWSEHSHCAIECTHCFMDVILGLFFNSVFARSVSVLPLTRAWTVVFFQNQVIHTLSYHNKQLPPLSIYWECFKCHIIVSALWMSLLSFGQTTANWELAAHTGNRGDTETFSNTCAAADQCDWYILGYKNWVCL